MHLNIRCDAESKNFYGNAIARVAPGVVSSPPWTKRQATALLHHLARRSTEKLLADLPAAALATMPLPCHAWRLLAGKVSASADLEHVRAREARGGQG